MKEFISISCLPLPTFVQGGYAIFDQGDLHPDRDNLQYFVLFVIVKGQLYIAEDGQNYTLKPGNVFILRPNHHHYSWKKVNQRTEYYWIHFSALGRWIEDSKPHQLTPSIDIPKLHYYTPSVTLILPKLQRLAIRDDIVPLIDRLLKITANQDNLGFWQGQQIFIDLIQLIQYVAPVESSSHQLSNQLMNYINSNFNQNITNKVLARHFHMHPNSLVNKFESSFHQTPKQYLNDYRLAVAAKRLQTTATSITTIASEVGFNNIYYFSKQFKRKYKITPTQYREQH